jgi:hypothetical protein
MDDLPEEVEGFAPLRRVRFFEDLTPEDLDRISTIGQRRSFEAGEAIASKDDDTGGLDIPIKNPSVAVHLLEVVAERLREVQDRVEHGG